MVPPASESILQHKGCDTLLLEPLGRLMAFMILCQSPVTTTRANHNSGAGMVFTFSLVDCH